MILMPLFSTACQLTKSQFTNFAQLVKTVGADIIEPWLKKKPPLATIQKYLGIWLSVRPVFVRLSDQDLLDRCSLGATQNQNESFNNIVWSLASKTQFLSKPTVTFAVNLSVIKFNEGMEKGLSVLLTKIGMEPGPRSIRFFKAADDTRIKKSDRKSEAVAKKRRKAKAKERAAENESNTAREGLMYGAGQF